MEARAYSLWLEVHPDEMHSTDQLCPYAGHTGPFDLPVSCHETQDELDKELVVD